jgi:hypothetical protein
MIQRSSRWKTCYGHTYCERCSQHQIFHFHTYSTFISLPFQDLVTSKTGAPSSIFYLASTPEYCRIYPKSKPIWNPMHICWRKCPYHYSAVRSDLLVVATSQLVHLMHLHRDIEVLPVYSMKRHRVIIRSSFIGELANVLICVTKDLTRSQWPRAFIKADGPTCTNNVLIIEQLRLLR